MPSSKVSRLKTLAISASVITNAVLGSHLLYVNGSTFLTNLTVTNPVNMSGGLIPMHGSISLTEEDGQGSGVYVLTNPVDYPVICDSVVVDTTTTPTSSMTADIFFSTGTTVAQTGSGNDIADNFAFAAATTTLSGSALNVDKKFKLAASSSTTANKSVVILSKAGTGHGLVGTMNVQGCQRKS